MRTGKKSHLSYYCLGLSHPILYRSRGDSGKILPGVLHSLTRKMKDKEQWARMVVGRAGQGRAGQGAESGPGCRQREYVQIQSGWRWCSSYCRSCRRGSRVPSQALLATAPSRASPEARCRGGERGSQRGSEGKWRMSQAGPEKRRIKAMCELSQAPARLCPGPGAAWCPGHQASRELEGPCSAMPRPWPPACTRDTQAGHTRAGGWT